MNFKSHPKGLYILFLTEMWERFSFYGLRALLVLYLTQAVGWSDVSAYGLFGAYAALVYATPVVGGIIADRYLGLKKSVYFGGFLIMLGHFTLALPFASHTSFYVGLAFVVCGTGYLKSCISSMVGALYDAEELRHLGLRDSGFTIFYMGINLGAFAAGIAVGVVAEVFGWHYGFGLAGIGMLMGLATYRYGMRYLEGVGEPPNHDRLRATLPIGCSQQSLIGVLSFLVVPLVAVLLHYPNVVGGLLLVMIGISALMIANLLKKSTPAQRKKLWGLVILTLFAMGFFSLFEQAPSSMNLFTERGVDRHLWGWLIPTPAFQSLNPLIILLFAPVFAWVWVWLAKKDREPSTSAKFFCGLLLVSLGFATLALGAYWSSHHGLAHMGWLVLAYFLQTFGELCLSPVGLSSVTRYSPPGSVGMMMGIWFLAMSTSNYLAAMMAKLAAVTVGSDGMQSQYAHAFTQVFVIGLGVTALMLLMWRPLQRLLSDTA